MVRKPEIPIQNIVASGSFGGGIDLESLFCNINAMCEPEQFPSVIYRIETPRVIFLIFSNDNIVCVGAKKEETIYEAVKNVGRMLEELQSL